MKKIKRILMKIYPFLLLFSLSFLGFANNSLASGFNPDNNPSLMGDHKRNVYQIGFGLGMTSYFGDLTNNNMKMPFYYRYGAEISVERDIFKAGRICINFFSGNILGDELTSERALNFKSSVIAPSATLSFNFLHWANKGLLKRHFATYISTGIEWVFFNAKGDLKNSESLTYYYWNDNTIHALPENAENASSALIIERDFKYETNYRNLDIDNLGKTNKSAAAIPLCLSVELKFENGIAIRTGATYHYVLTDYLDNISYNSLGNRQGKKGNDSFIFYKASVFYTLPMYFRSKKNIKKT